MRECKCKCICKYKCKYNCKYNCKYKYNCKCKYTCKCKNNQKCSQMQECTFTNALSQMFACCRIYKCVQICTNYSIICTNLEALLRNSFDGCLRQSWQRRQTQNLSWGGGFIFFMLARFWGRQCWGFLKSSASGFVVLQILPSHPDLNRRSLAILQLIKPFGKTSENT